MDRHLISHEKSFGFSLSELKEMQNKLKQCPNSCISDCIGINVTAKHKDNKFNHPLSKLDNLKISTLLCMQKIIIPLIIIDIIVFVIFLITIKSPLLASSEIIFNISLYSFIISTVLYIPIQIYLYLYGWYNEHFTVYYDTKLNVWHPLLYI